MPKLKRKSFLSFVSITLALLIQFTALTPISVSAGGTPQNFSQFITNVMLTITDSSGNTTYATLDKDSTAADSVNIPKNSTVMLSYDYSIPDDTVIGNGDQYSMMLPAIFSVPYAESGDLGSLGTYTFNTDNSVSVTFGSGGTGTKDRHGTLGLTATFRQSEIGSTSPVNVIFSAQGGPITIPINFQQLAPAPPAITKSTGGYNASDGTISWTLTVKASSSDLTNVVVRDTLGDHQTFNPSSVSATPAAVTASENGSAIGFSVGSMTKNTTETITYTTTPTSDAFIFPADTTTFTNSATLTADGIDTVGPANAQATVGNHWIAKSGTYVDGGTQSSRSIRWTINIDPDGRTIPGPFTVTDPLPNQYLAVTGAVTAGETAIPEDESATPSESVYYTLSTASGKQTIVFHFQNGISTLTPLVFSTAIDPDYFNSNGSVSFDNTATITNSGDSKSVTAVGGTVGLPAGVIGKTGVIGTSGIDYDASTHLMTWQLTVDDNKVAMTGPFITDTLDDNQEFYQGSVSDQAIQVSGLSGYDYIPFNASGGFMSTPYYTLSADKKTIKVYLPDVAANQADIVLKYQTLVTNPDYYAANNTNKNSNKVGNTAKLTTTNGVGGTASASEPVISTVIAKTGTSYDYNTRQIGWKVTVDQNVMPMTNATMTDPIQDGQTFVENGGVKVDGTAIGKDTPLTGSNFYYTYGAVDGKPALAVHLGDIAEQHVVTFSTQVTDLSVFEQSNQNVNFYNTATLGMDDAQSVDATGSEPVTNWMLQKGDTYASGNLYIDWWVHINGNQIPMGSFLSGSSITLTDTLQMGLDLDTASVRLYPMVSSSGNPSDLQEDTSHPVTIPASSIQYDPVTRVFTFTLPTGLDLSRAYSLDFRTFVTDQSQSPFINSVTMTGTASGSQGHTSAVTIVHYNNQGTGYGTTGSITVNKTDGSGAILDGAVFDLLDWRGEVVREETTGENGQPNGQVVFDRLDYSDSVNNYPYTIVEKTPPANYDLATPSSYTFTLDRSNGSDMLHFLDGSTTGSLLMFQDSRKTGKIELTKVDQDGKGLGGAIFRLYDAGGNQVGDPQTSNPDGLVTFSGVPYGVYTIRETGVPADYIASGGSITANLTDGNGNIQSGTLDLGAVTNTIKTAGIQLIKLGTGGEKLRGATFTLYDSAGKNAILIGGSPVTATSDADGLAVFQTICGPYSIPYGDYVIKETAPPADYTSCAAISVSLHDSNSELSNGVLMLGNVRDALKLGSITFTKLDENGRGLADATFVLKDANGNLVGDSQTSDENGKVTFKNAPYGDGYSITETQAPADYTALSVPIMGINLHTPQVVLQSVSDSRLTGSISFTKVDENRNLLAGAEFTLYDPIGKQVGLPQTSDEYGKVTFTAVPFKDGYTIRETKTPENYAVHAAFTVNLHTDSYDYGSVVDDLLRGDIQVKKTDPSGYPLAGSTFTLYDVNGKAISQAVSDSNGIAVFADVPYGDYTVRETAAPEGCGNDKDAHKVSLNVQNPAPTIIVIGEKIPLTPNPKTGDEKGFPLAEAGALALASGDVILSRKMRFWKRNEK